MTTDRTSYLILAAISYRILQKGHLATRPNWSHRIPEKRTPNWSDITGILVNAHLRMNRCIDYWQAGGNRPQLRFDPMCSCSWTISVHMYWINAIRKSWNSWLTEQYICQEENYKLKLHTAPDSALGSVVTKWSYVDMPVNCASNGIVVSMKMKLLIL